MIFDSNVHFFDVRLAVKNAKTQGVDGICITSLNNFKAPKTNIVITKGTEIEFEYDLSERAALEVSRTDFDYVVNSVKTLNGNRLDDFDFYKTASRSEIYSAYLEKVFDSLDAAFSFNVLGNISFVSKYANYPLANIEFNEFPELLEAILMRTVFLGKGLEIDCSLAARGILFPSVSILEKYLELGGSIITLASNSSVCGKGIKEAQSILKTLGFSSFSVFKNMHSETFPL